MTELLGPTSSPDLSALPLGGVVEQVGQLNQLLSQLDQPLVEELSAAAAVVAADVDQELVVARLGIASSLHLAMRCRSPALAAHNLRVALNCSAWAYRLGWADAERQRLEVAALLHDLGMLGLPDQVLLKPGPLTAEEALLVERARKMGTEILRCSCLMPGVPEIVDNVPAWYDGTRAGYAVAGTDIPLAARIIALVEAFDAMTSDQVFRRAMPHELALREVFNGAGTQFDPMLVGPFVDFLAADQTAMRADVAERWIERLDGKAAGLAWGLPACPDAQGQDPFAARLLESMHDAVLFVDSALQVVQWNHGAERLTGITAESMRQRPWSPRLLGMQNEKAEPLLEDDCPVFGALRSGTQSLRRLAILGRDRKLVSVDAHTIPVLDAEGRRLGAVLLLHDASPEASLEERCQSLHERATRDPLTQVANRAEFDRVHEMFIEAHRQQNVPCALIICDLDHFKSVNDTYGHQAGDEVIKALAGVLRNACQPGDLAARYGGEEFVLLCAKCDNAAAFRRAEQVRTALAAIAQPCLGGKVVTASFGAAEIQPGDTAETMLRRADRALLLAKSRGRNMVVQLGVGCGPEREERKAWIWPFRPASPQIVLQQDLVTPVPVAMAVEKLRGFVSDHGAKIVKVDGNVVELQISDDRLSRRRRWGDRAVAFTMTLEFSEEVLEKPERSAGQTAANAQQTRIQAKLSPVRNRDRRREDVMDRGRQLLCSLRSYLIATFADADNGRGVLHGAKRMLMPWLMK